MKLVFRKALVYQTDSETSAGPEEPSLRAQHEVRLSHVKKLEKVHSELEKSNEIQRECNETLIDLNQLFRKYLSK